MNIQPDSRIAVNDDVLFRDMDGEAIILNLNTESYFGLDDIGTEMWKVLTSANSIEEALNLLHQTYEVDEQLLRADAMALIRKLVDLGMLELVNA